jgi:BlaI family penicillinase repressor
MERIPDVPDAELAVLRALWDKGPATIRQLTDALYPGGNEAHYATVQKLLDRLEAKGCIARDTTARAHSFRATVDRQDLIGRQLQTVAEKLCEGSMTPLLTHLVRAKRLKQTEWEELRKLIDELAPATSRKVDRRSDERNRP